MEIVGEEMFRTTEWFWKKQQEWRSRVSSSLGSGYQAWASRQAALWQALHNHSATEFSEAQRVWKAPIVNL